MKENSIEEDIVKKFEEFCEDLYIFKDDDMGGHFEGVVGDQIANTKLGYLIFKEKLEDFLSDYKRVLKENEELKNKLLDTLEGQKVIEEETPQYIKENYISKEKVKDKIEELNSRIETYREYVERGIAIDIEWVDNVADRETVKVLQKLLEGRE